MKAIFLIKTGNPKAAFEVREIARPEPAEGQVLIQVEAFGLNFADVMARKGLYDDAPPMPCVLGYDVVGKIVKTGNGVTGLKEGQRVTALTRFGGYAEYAVTDAKAAVPVPDSLPAGKATALATQYITAYYCAEIVTTLQEGEHVLIHAAAGGVGTALVQIAKSKGCIIYGTASENKLKILEEAGVNYPINYREADFEKAIRTISGKRGVDIIFDSTGGTSVRKGYRLLNIGGRMVCLGASNLISAKGNIFKLLNLARGFGIYTPINMFKKSKSLICVNMLHIADHRPDIIQTCLLGVMSLYEKGIIDPLVGGEFHVNQIADAHSLLESRNSTGKIVVKW